MKYQYYSGCSLEKSGTAREYGMSSRAVLEAVGAELLDIADWTCCGASAAEAVSSLLALVLPARNLALASGEGKIPDIVAPCSACALNLKRAEVRLAADGVLRRQVNEVLEAEGLHYEGGVRVRHLLDVLATDVGAGRVRAKVRKPLEGLKVAPYYGCQVLRPFGDFDDPERPRSMESLLEALGVEVFPWSMGGKCCGAGLMTTKREAALDLTGAILASARGAHCIVTVCPLCQMNLESAQASLSRRRGEDCRITVLYLPQLMGLALGLPEEDLGLRHNLALSPSFRQNLL